jgi:hypothetical protein
MGIEEAKKHTDKNGHRLPLTAHSEGVDEASVYVMQLKQPEQQMRNCCKMMLAMVIYHG